MKHPLLIAEERTILGKKVKKLRREGLLPANVYGKALNSQAVQVKLSDFTTIFKEAGETGLVDLQFNGKTKPVLIKNLQMNYQSRTPLHADFYQVNLKEKVKTMVPLELIGEAKAVADKIGMLLQTLSEIEIEALPDQLPDHIDVSVENLAALEENVTVGDITPPEGVTILTDAGQAIAKITELQVEEPEPEAAAPAEGTASEAAVPQEAAAEEPQAEK